MVNSNESMVTVRDVKRANSGTYRCEVSGEAPDFETDYREANMSVVGNCHWNLCKCPKRIVSESPKSV